MVVRVLPTYTILVTEKSAVPDCMSILSGCDGSYHDKDRAWMTQAHREINLAGDFAAHQTAEALEMHHQHCGGLQDAQLFRSRHFPV